MSQNNSTTDLLADEDTGPTGPSHQRPMAGDLVPVGTVLDDHVVVALLGQGGFGSVYEVEDRRTGQRVAMKVLHRSNPDDNAAARFAREIDVVRGIEHANLVRIHRDGALDTGQLYYTMELLRGQTLRSRVHQSKGLAPEECLAIFEPLCDALDTVHRHGVVHRDLKVSNIFLADQGLADQGLDARGQSPRVVLLDFGVAKLMDDDSDKSLTRSREMVGTLSQMAPEQLLSLSVDARTDVYALGGLLFRMLTATHPFRVGDPKLVREFHLTARRPRPSTYRNLPPALDAVVERAMAIGKQARYPGAREFLDALRRAVASSSGRASTADTASATAERHAVGLYVGIHVDDEDAMDDDGVLDLMDEMADSISSELSASGMIAVVETATEFLFIEPMESPSDVTARRKVLARAHRVLRTQRPALLAESRIHLRLCLHVDQVIMDDQVVSGGDLVDFSSWAAVENDGLTLTASFGNPDLAQ